MNVTPQQLETPIDSSSMSRTFAAPDEADPRPGLAIVANVMTPYRMQLHALIASGIPELKLHTLITHGAAEFDWKLDVPESIHVRTFGAPDDSPVASPLRGARRDWRKGGRLIEYLRTNNVRAVITFGYRYLSYLRVVRYCRRAGLPTFLHNDSNVCADRHLSRLKRWCKSRVYGWWLSQVSGVMTMGEYGDQFFLAYGADPKRLYRVPCTPDYDAYTRVDAGRLSEFRRRFGLDQGRRYLLYSGRLAPEKRVDLLIAAFTRIAPTRPNWRLMIVGDGVLRNDLQRQVPDSLRSHIIWTGFLDGAEPAVAYHAADALVLPSDRDAWALVVQEAMAAGLTVVASDVVGAAREMVSDNWSGRIFSAGDLDGLVAALLDITDANRIDVYRRQAQESFTAWRNQSQPVAEVRRALVDANVLPQPPTPNR